MGESDILILVALCLYMAVVVGIGIFFAKRANSSSEEYYLGGRKLGPWVTAMSAEASDMSGWLLMGLPGLAFLTGANEAVWTAIGLALGTYLNWKIVAVRLRKYSQKAGNAITIPDFLSNRFHDNKKVLMSVAALFILVFFAIYVGSCFVTTGKLFNTLFGLPYIPMMIVGALIVFVYTTLGGFLAESVSDFIQGIVMILALVTVVIGSMVMVGGMDNAAALLQSIPGFGSLVESPQYLKVDGAIQMDTSGAFLFAADPTADFGFIAIISTLAWGLGYFGMPQVLLRFMAIRDSKEIGRSRRIAVTWCVISLFAAVGIGLIGRAIWMQGLLPMDFSAAGGYESIFIVLATTMLPAFIAGIVVSGIFAATMSSADSYMLIASSAIAQNLFKGLFNKKASDKAVMMAARLTMVLVLIFGILIALDENSSIFKVVSYAWAGFGATFGPVILASLFWRRVNLPGALAGMIAGGASIFIWHELIAPLGGVFAIYELLPGFIIGALALAVVSLLTKPPSEEITEEFDHYMELDA